MSQLCQVTGNILDIGLGPISGAMAVLRPIKENTAFRAVDDLVVASRKDVVIGLDGSVSFSAVSGNYMLDIQSPSVFATVRLKIPNAAYASLISVAVLPGSVPLMPAATNVIRLSDYLHQDDLAAIMAGDTAAQNGGRVTASIRAFHEAALATLLTTNGAHVRAVYPGGMYRINDRLMSDAFNNTLWAAPVNARSKLTLAADGVVTFRVQNWVPGRASVRTDGIYAGNTRLVPNAVMEWMQPSGYQQFARMEGHFIIEGANNIDTDPTGFYFYRTNGLHIDGQIEVRDLRNRGVVLDSVFNSPRIEHIKLTRSVGLQLTEAAGSGLLPSDTVTTVDGDRVRTGLRYTVSGTTLTVQTVAFNETDAVLVSSTPATGIFTADHVGKWIGLDRQGPEQITTSDADDGEESETVSGRSVTRWFQIAAFVDSGTVTLTEAPPFSGNIGQRQPHQRRFTFGPLRVTIAAGSNTATLSMPVTTSLVGHEVVIPGAGYQTPSLRTSMAARNLVAMVTAHTGNTITLSHAARRSRSGVPLIVAPMLHVGTMSYTQFLDTSRKCDHLHIDALWIEGSTSPGVSLFTQDVTKFTIGEGSKLHGSPTTAANYGANFALVVTGDVGGRWDGAYTHSRHSREWGMFYIAADRVELKIDGEVSSWTADAGSSLFYLDPIGEDASPDWDLYFNAIDYASGFPNVSGGQVFERGGANYVRGLVKSASSVRMPRAERPVWPPTQLSPSRAPWWGSTRADAVSALTRGGVVPENGVVYTIGGQQYIGVTGSTIISGLPGLEPYGAWTPLHFGAAGDGVADDGAAFNALTAAYRVRLGAVTRLNSALILDGLGLRYRSTVSIDFTHMRAWGKSIRDFTIISEAAGKTAFDMIGSRGGIFENVTIIGAQSAMPRVGIMLARSVAAGFGFCDVWQFRGIKTRGYYSLTGFYGYGYESCKFDHCQFWNDNPAAHQGVHVGWDLYAVESDYQTAQTGEVSFIQNEYDTTEWRHLPSDTAALVTNITQAAQAVITLATTPNFTIGQTITIYLVNGMTQINDITAQVVNVSGNTITINTDTTGFGAYTSGGQVQLAQSVPSVVWGRGNGHFFNNCYIVAFGVANIQMVCPPSGLDVVGCRFDFLFEGASSPANIAFTHGAVDYEFVECEFSSYQTAGKFAVMTSGATGSAKLKMSLSTIDVGSNIRGRQPVLMFPPAAFSLQGVDIKTYRANTVNLDTVSAFRGTLMEMPDGRQYVGGAISGLAKAGETWGISVRGTEAITSVIGEIRYTRAQNAWTVAADGAVIDYVLADTAFYPNPDNGKSLGLINARWSTVHSMVNRTGLDLIVGENARIQFANDAGSVKGQFSYNTSTDILTAALNGTTSNYAWGATAYYPATDNGQQLGLLAARWSTVHAANVRATTYRDNTGTQVLSTRQAAIPDATGGTEVATINSILAALRAHGIIAT